MAMSEEHRQKLRSNRVRLADDLEISEELLAVLIQRKIITPDTKEIIEAETVRRKQAQKLLDTLPRRGKMAFEAFIEALCQSSQGDLAELLDEQLYRKHTTGSYDACDDVPTVVEISSEEKIKKILTEAETEPFMVQVNHMQPDMKRKLNPTFAYPISDPCGRALIFGNEKPDKSLGIDFDLRNLCSLFRQLRFEAVVMQDLTKSEILSCLQKEAQNPNHKSSSAFVLCIINYGGRDDEIFDRSGQRIDIEKEILSLFDGAKCPLLSDKPKFYLIHTGEPERRDGEKTRQEQPMQTDGVDAFDSVDGANSSPPISPVNRIIVHEKADVLKIVSTSEVWRNNFKGSWFIRCLSSVISSNAGNQDLVEMITQVNNVIEHLKGEGKRLQLVQKKSTLRKKFYLMPWN